MATTKLDLIARLDAIEARLAALEPKPAAKPKK
jgi:hypothetical protein